MAERKLTVTIDPSRQFERKLRYLEKHSGWHIFKSIYWGAYIFIMGLILLTLVPGTVSYSGFFGWALVLFALFYVLHGFAVSSHLKLMKKHA